MTPREILEEVKRRIIADPGAYNQDTFCGMQCCIGGHIDIIINGPEIHRAREGREGLDAIIRTSLEAIGETDDVWLFGQANNEPDEDEREPDDWPLDLSLAYEHADDEQGRALVGCTAIDRYIEERGL